MNTVEEGWAWAAGFYEGEGSVVNHSKNSNLSLQIGQKDPEPLYAFMGIAECGSVYGPYTNTIPGRVVYSYRVTVREDVYYVIGRLWPWLSLRRKEQIAMAIERSDLARNVV